MVTRWDLILGKGLRLHETKTEDRVLALQKRIEALLSIRNPFREEYEANLNEMEALEAKRDAKD